MLKASEWKHFLRNQITQKETKIQFFPRNLVTLCSAKYAFAKNHLPRGKEEEKSKEQDVTKCSITEITLIQDTTTRSRTHLSKFPRRLLFSEQLQEKNPENKNKEKPFTKKLSLYLNNIPAFNPKNKKIWKSSTHSNNENMNETRSFCT